MENERKSVPVKRGFAWTALVVAFMLGVGVATVMGVYLDLTPTGQAVRRLSSVNIDMTESYRATTEALVRRIKVLDAKIDRLLGESETVETFVKPKTIPLFDPSDVAICGFKDGESQICAPSGQWTWDPPLAKNEWDFCKLDDGAQVPCNFARQPTFTGHQEL